MSWPRRDEVVVFYAGRICARLRGEDLDAHTMLEVMNTGVMPRASAGAAPEGAREDNA